jgi:uncharacterized protein (DUF1015 family)
MYVYRQDFVAPDGNRRRLAGVSAPSSWRRSQRPRSPTTRGCCATLARSLKRLEDRLELLRATRLNVSPIYTVYRGNGELRAAMDRLDFQDADSEVVDAGGTRHRLWRIEDADDIELLSAAVAPVPLMIADGHQRYEAARIHNADHFEGRVDTSR